MKLQDFPEFNAAVEKLRAAEEKLHSGEKRKGEINDELSSASPAVRAAFGPDWRNEYEQLERHEALTAYEVNNARQELDTIRGRCSFKICESKPVRSKFIEATRKVIQGLKMICDGNASLTAIRDELEREGIVTGSIPNSQFILGATWADPYGGKIVGYRREIRQNFPEPEKEVE